MKEAAKARGYAARGLPQLSYVGVDPADRLLIGHSHASAAAGRDGAVRHRPGGTRPSRPGAQRDQALGSKAFAQARLGQDAAVGAVDPDRLNRWGGSLALGHPVAATGARMVTTAARGLVREDAETAILGICAAGGLGAAAVLERV